MAPRRRSTYEESTSDDSSDATFEPLPTKRRKQVNMADQISQEGVRKRGRGPSKRPCLNRNAQMARENRQKKKEYVQRIENRLAQLQQENKNLNNLIQQQNIDIKKLNADVLYLRSVLNNKSSITMLLKSMNQNLQRFRTKTEREAAPLVNQRVTFSNLENSEMKPFTEDYKFKREASEIPHNGNYQDLAEVYRMNNNVIKTAEDQTFGNSEQEEKSKNLLPDTPISMNGKSEMVINEADINEFSNLNSENIFDELAQLDEASHSLDFGQDSCSALDDNFFQGLDENSGICLHVSPSRVSLEFCSSCQMNSANSVFE